MPLISSILVGTTNGCTCVGYVPPPKKINSLDSSDLTRARRLTALPTLNYSQRPFDYSQLQDMRYANRTRVPLNLFFGQNFQ